MKKWEKEHGQIPAGAFVAMRTDWSKRWPDAAKMENKDANGVAHYPGWSLAVLKYLYEDRKITASGHETTDTDPGIAASKDDYSLETYILIQTIIKSNCLRILIKFPKPARWSWSVFPNRKADPVSPRGYLRSCRRAETRYVKFQGAHAPRVLVSYSFLCQSAGCARSLVLTIRNGLRIH